MDKVLDPAIAPFVSAEAPITPELLRRLLDLNALLRTHLPLDALLQSVLEAAVETIAGAHAGSVLVREGHEYRFRATVGYDLDKLDAIRLRERELFSLMHFESLMIIPGLEDQSSAENKALLRRYGRLDDIRATVIAPILIDDQVYGHLAIDNLDDDDPFLPAARPLLLLFAQQATTLIEQKMLLDNVRRTQAQLIETAKLAALGQLVGGVAHEINNPLGALIGCTELLQLYGLDAESQGLIGDIRQSADRIKHIIRNLLLFARSQAAGRQTWPLIELAEQTLALRRAQLQSHGVRLITERMDRAAYVVADRGQIQQVILNLLLNAEQAVSEIDGERRIEIRIEADLARARVALEVMDNGPGIAPEHMSHILEPFFTTRPIGTGTGLGLSICYGTVTAHGGSLTVESAPGQGACFRVELPLVDAHGAGVGPREPAPEQPRGQQVLLVGAEPHIARYITGILEPANRVEQASDGLAALRRIVAEPYDVLITYSQLADMSGRELLEQLVDAKHKLARTTVFLAGPTDDPAGHDWPPTTRQPVVLKPFTPDELVRAVAQVAPAVRNHPS